MQQMQYQPNQCKILKKLHTYGCHTSRFCLDSPAFEAFSGSHPVDHFVPEFLTCPKIFDIPAILRKITEVKTFSFFCYVFTLDPRKFAIFQSCRHFTLQKCSNSIQLCIFGVYNNYSPTSSN